MNHESVSVVIPAFGDCPCLLEWLSTSAELMELSYLVDGVEFKVFAEPAKNPKGALQLCVFPTEILGFQ